MVTFSYQLQITDDGNQRCAHCPRNQEPTRSDGTGECTPCLSNFETTSPGSYCTPCEIHDARNFYDEQCTYCGNHQYRHNAALPCRACPDETPRRNLGAMDCEPLDCNTGHYATLETDMVCTPCPSNSMPNLETLNLGECIPCGVSESALDPASGDECTNCPINFDRHTSWSECRSCGKHRYRHDDNVMCRDCTVEAPRRRLEEDDCMEINCGPGHHANNNTDYECIPCLQNFEPGPKTYGQGGCVPCDVNYDAVDPASGDECTVCALR